MNNQPTKRSAENIPAIGHGGRPMQGGRGGGPMGGRMNVQKPKNTAKTIARLVKYIGKSRALIISLLAIMAVVTILEVIGPLMQSNAIDCFEVTPDEKIIVHFDAYEADVLDENGNVIGTETRRGLWFCISAMAIIFAGIGIFTFVQSLIAAKLSQSTVYVMRRDLFRKITKLPIKYTDTHRHGDIMSRMTNDVENVSNAVSQSIASLFSSVLTLIGVFSMMLYFSWILTLVACVTIPLTVLISTTLAKYMRKHYKKRQQLLGALNGQVEEMVTGYKTVVAYGKEKQAVSDFSATSDTFRDVSIRARVWGSIMGPLMNILGNLQYLLIAAFGGYLLLHPIAGMRRLSVGNIQAMLQYSKKFTRPINEIANQYATILTALAGAERIFEIMDGEDEIDEGKNALTVDSIRGDIHFKDIDFSYVEGEPVLKKLDLWVRPGQKVAIVGATGSGKTTIVNLLTRFYEVDSGVITVDGIDIREIPKDTLRRAIAIVLQDTVLFSDSIRTNIMYGKENATEEEISSAAATAHAATFIERLPDGYETVLAESGSNLSQGQRQLLSIARAVLADPKILILDEATSSVDTRTEMHIQQAMVALMRDRTSLIIAHRLSTIRDADKIVVIKDGHVAEAGDHETLLALGGEYSKLYANQFAGIAT